MAKKKIKKNKFKLNASQERDVVAILLGALSLFTLVSIFGFGGAAGDIAGKALRSVLGIGMYLVPLFIGVWAIVFIVEKWRDLIVSKGAGLLFVFFSFISVVHLSLPQAEKFDPSRVGDFGGYVGAVISYALAKIAGVAGAYIILSAILLIGVVITAGISLSDISEEVMSGGRKRLASTKKRRKSLPVQISAKSQPKAEVPKTSAQERLAETIRIEETQVSEQKTPLPPAALKDKTYTFPPLDLLVRSPLRSKKVVQKGLAEQTKALEEALRDFGVDAVVARVVTGPTVVRYELQLGSGVKVNRIVSLSNDLARALAATDVRILAPIPGKTLVGIEVPSGDKEMVSLGDVLAVPEAAPMVGPLMAGIGKDISGGPVIVNLSHMPHLLIAGATGSGKTTCVNSIITSLLFFSHPDQVKMILVDPKMVELTYYKDIPHLLAPVITDPRRASKCLGWAVKEMERRFKQMGEAGARNIDNYNAELAEDAKVMPYLVIVIDELADLMMVAPAEVEESICRLSQMGRAVGIYLVVATQRPSVDVITGLIKANIPSRISFEVASLTDSRVILDMAGAEKLMGSGDMLYLAAGSTKPQRVQGAYLSETEINAVTGFVRSQRDPDYNNDILEEDVTNPWGTTDYVDPMLDQAIEVVVRTGAASISMLQRRLRVGYSRAARMVDTMEERGIVGGADGSKPRAVMLSEEEFERLRSGE